MIPRLVKRLVARAVPPVRRDRAKLAIQNGWHRVLAPTYRRLYGWPPITFVVVGRSDLYDGDLGRRLAATLEWNLGATKGQAIYVEWNPAPDSPLDAPWLVRRFPGLRVYVVSPERHQDLSTNPNIPAMEYFAKNVGIRRATTPWIAVINADIALGPDLITKLPVVRDPLTVYGGNGVSIEWNGERVTEALLRDPARHVSTSLAGPSLIGHSGNFLLAHRDLWHLARGYDEKITDRRVGCDDHALLQLRTLGARTRILGNRYEFDHPGSYKHGPKPHHGDRWDFRDGVPYRNSDDWGLGRARERQIGDRTWYIE